MQKVITAPYRKFYTMPVLPTTNSKCMKMPQPTSLVHLQTDSDDLKFKSLYNLGNSYFHQGNYEKAFENFKRALAIDKYKNDKDALYNRDLAEKKLKEQQKQQQQSDPDQDGEKQDRKQDSQKQSSEQQQQQQAESESDNASSRNQSAQNESGDSSEKQQQEQNASDPGENESAGAEKDPGEEQEEQASSRPEKGDKQGAKKTQPREGEQKRVQAETMLNRLEDKPGRALMPAYGETRIEKDW